MKKTIDLKFWEIQVQYKTGFVPFLNFVLTSLIRTFAMFFIITLALIGNIWGAFACALIFFIIGQWNVDLSEDIFVKKGQKWYNAKKKTKA